MVPASVVSALHVEPRLPAARGAVSDALFNALRRTPGPISSPAVESVERRICSSLLDAWNAARTSLLAPRPSLLGSS